MRIQDYFPVFDACGAAVFLILTAIHLWSRRKGIFVAVVWNLTGVILHELAHLIIGLLFRAGPTGFSIIPRRSESGWKLGSVTFGKINAFNAVPIALAPLWLAFAAYVVWNSWSLWFIPTFTSTIWRYVVMFFLLYNAAPSRQDLKVACNWKSLLLYGTTGSVICWFLYVR